MSYQPVSTPHNRFGNRRSAPLGAPDDRSILIVDDDEVQLAYLSLVIREAGDAVRSAENGLAALQACRDRLPALVISDVEMPEMNGLGLLRALRGHPGLTNLPIFLCSATVQKATRQTAMRAGADQYFDKPIDADQLLGSIAKVVPADTWQSLQ